MSANTALKTLRDSLKRGTFDGAYYVSGEDDFQKDDAVKQLVDAAVEPVAPTESDVRELGKVDNRMMYMLGSGIAIFVIFFAWSMLTLVSALRETADYPYPPVAAVYEAPATASEGDLSGVRSPDAPAAPPREPAVARS